MYVVYQSFYLFIFIFNYVYAFQYHIVCSQCIEKPLSSRHKAIYTIILDFLQQKKK
jgi:hypothetical protein